ncbi:winged helix-turn-helix transcriptional regulator [Catenulispora rubra]|uniref:winged helix-turn-helix transcriptional regulator n=1 Tax=Catenulispora rubra TaxID=280293 RepID=UPI002B2755C1|nr:helix-turn-helix domain-containing protein [Catenulispora rubra]
METIEVQAWNLFEKGCPSRQIFERISDRWTGIVLMALEDGTLRFSELKRKVEGVSQKMLTQTLRALERDGLVTREVFPTVPVTVEYTLTRLGASLLATVQQVRAWAYANIEEIDAARGVYDRRALSS